ncbi:DUF2779 domain-containing protein [Bacteroidota bacterium]
MKKFLLSKSSFLKGVQCKKFLYLYKYHPELQDEIGELQKSIFEKGISVGKVAQQLFPGGTDVSPKTYNKFNASLNLTKRLLKEKNNTIYEAAFLYNDIIVFSDIAVKDKEGCEIYEVKSSTSINETHIMDAAIQYYVINNSGNKIKDFFLVYINNKYVRKKSLDLKKLFIVESLGELVKAEQSWVKRKIKEFKEILCENKEPVIDIGEHCSYPYNCNYRGYCWKHIPEGSIFEISNMHLKKKFELYKTGFLNIEDIPMDISISDKQRLQIESYKSGKSFINKKEIKNFINTLSYPLYFMDFETFQSAIPHYVNSRPYQQIPFQFSVHYKESNDSELMHFEFLADTDSDPRIPFIENLINVINSKGDILVYNKSFEISRLNELARDFPKYKSGLNNLIMHIKDLMIPFQKKYYYTPSMKGSHSIKYVLPSLIPDLSYKDLEISEGSEASLAYERLFNENDMFEVERIRNGLLEYCKLDTLGMVRILEVLERVATE